MYNIYNICIIRKTDVYGDHLNACVSVIMTLTWERTASISIRSDDTRV